MAPDQKFRQNVWTKEESADTIDALRYSPSPQRKVKGIQISPKAYARLTGELNTHFPGLAPEDGTRVLYMDNYAYRVEADGFGGLYIRARIKLK